MKKSTGWPSEADRTDRPAGPDNAASVDVSCWDVASIQKIDAMQRKATFAACLSKSYRCRNGTSALPSEAES
jgi:GTPase SAR1 family protein